MRVPVDRLMSLAASAVVCGACAVESTPRASNFADEEYVAVAGGDIRLFYRAIGSGADTIVVVHGGPDLDLAYIAPDLEPLAASHTLIFYDQRGAGRSTLVSDPAAVHIDAHVADLDALRRHFGLERVALLGHSFGALIAARYASLHANRLSKLVLVSPAPPRRTPYWAEIGPAVTAWMDSATSVEVGRLSAAQTDTAQDAHATCRAFWRVFVRGYLADPNDDAAIRRMRGDFCDAPAPALRNRFVVAPITRASLGDWDWRDDFREVRAPVLVITGVEDLFSVESFHEWKDAFPRGRLVRIEGAGHLPYVERPDEFFSALTEFLR